jgi:steroid 5-alpha reductase family enzyme
MLYPDECYEIPNCRFSVHRSDSVIGVPAELGTRHLHVLAAGAIAIQWAVFLLQASGLLLGNAPTEKYYDLTGAVTFFSLTLLSYMHVKNPSWRQALLSSFVMIWCIRLGGFLFNRICRANGRDSRFDNIRTKFLYFWNLWTIQVR